MGMQQSCPSEAQEQTPVVGASASDIAWNRYHYHYCYRKAEQHSAHDSAADHHPEEEKGVGTHLLSLPTHVISSLILPRVSCPHCCLAFLATCKAARGLSSTTLQADWLEKNRPATALQLAAQPLHRGGSEALVLELLDRPGVLEASAAKDGNPALVNASMSGYSQAVRRLLMLPAGSASAEKFRGLSALMGASRGGHVHLVEELLQKWVCKSGLASRDIALALHPAVHNGHSKVVHVLLRAGAA